MACQVARLAANSSGNLAMFAAIRRASSRVTVIAAAAPAARKAITPL